MSPLLLEGEVNSACSNHSVEAKIREPGMLQASSLCAVQAFAARYAPLGALFDKAALQQRSVDIAALALRSWAL